MNAVFSILVVSFPSNDFIQDFPVEVRENLSAVDAPQMGEITYGLSGGTIYAFLFGKDQINISRKNKIQFGIKVKMKL